ncbi:hypothetical protein KIPB_017046, partial [Kipferlia bialata]
RDVIPVAPAVAILQGLMESDNAISRLRERHSDASMQRVRDFDGDKLVDPSLWTSSLVTLAKETFPSISSFPAAQMKSRLNKCHAALGDMDTAQIQDVEYV